MITHNINCNIDALGLAQELTQILAALAQELEVAEQIGDEDSWIRIQAQAQLAERHCREFLEILQPSPAVRLNVSQSVLAVRADIRQVVPDHVRLTLGPIDPNLFVMTSQKAIPRILNNLVENAVHALGQRPGSVFVQADVTGVAPNRGMPAGQYVVLSVTDSGPGLDDDGLSRIFDLGFSQRGERGSSLGMACLLQIARRWGGCMRVASQKGLGTRIECLLPSIG